jgi:hypothetical protein
VLGAVYRAAVESLSVILCPLFRLHCNVERPIHTRLFFHFPQNESYTVMEIILKQQSALSEEARAKRVFWEEI